MNTLTIKLKQHTPLIHFQHDQDGATLRASEVKPKLDKYILTQLGAGDYEKGKVEAKAKGWLVGKGDYPALNYKMRIEAEGRRYEHKIKVINAEKNVVFSERTSITFFCLNSSLIEEIRKNIDVFFVVYNFGFRQTKGYGSFTVEKGNKTDIGYCQSILENQGKYDTTVFSTISPETRTRYTLKKVRVRLNDKDKKDKNVKNEINKFKNIIINANFNALSCLEDYKEAIIDEINKKVKEVQKLQNSCIDYYKSEILEGLNKSKKEIECVHNDFLYNYFEKILDKTIIPTYQCYKSGRNYPYEKSHLRNFLGEVKGDTEIVFWDKRFMKQKINKLIDSKEEIKRLNLTLKDDYRKNSRGGSELSNDDSKDQSYYFIRALLGLEGNFEFQTNDKYKRFVVSVDGNDIERFQSVIIFKVINNVIFTCIKPKEELKKILNKGFSLKLNVKDTNGKSYIKEPITLGIIRTPDLKDNDIEILYQDIKSFFNKESQKR